MKKRILPIIAAILMCMISMPVYADITTGLSAYYPFNGNANDESANSNDGSVIGVTLTTDRFGSADRAYYFDGTDDYIQTSLDPDGTTFANWTVSCWIKGDNAPSSAEHNGAVYDSEVFCIVWDHSIEAFRGAASVIVGGTWYTASFGTLNASAWYHLAATYDGESLFCRSY